jgi:hypothetical protein
MPLAFVECDTLTKTHGWQRSWVFVSPAPVPATTEKYELDDWIF